MKPAVRIQRNIGSLHCISSQLSHLCKDGSKLKLFLWKLLGEIFLKLIIGYFVALLEASVILTILLDGVIGEMHHGIADFLQVEQIRRCSDVALTVPIGSDPSVHSGDNHVVADIELPAAVKQRPLYVLLEDEGFVLAIFVFLSCPYQSFYLTDFFDDCYPVSSVAILSWLQNPNIPELLLFFRYSMILLCELLELRIILS